MTLRGPSEATSPAPRCHALVPCAGIGERAGPGGPKQYRRVAGRSVVAHTLGALARVTRLASILVVLSPEDREFESHLAPDSGVASFPSDPELMQRLRVARVGGATRAATVTSGLAALAELGVPASDWVLVHDAARCLIQPQEVDRLIDACQGDPVGGLLALPVADTLQREVARGEGAADVASAARAAQAVDRRGLWQAQTPQMFRLGLLRDALAAAGEAVTDEASAIERLGHAPRLVPGALENFKLTWPADFALAERLLRTRP